MEPRQISITDLVEQLDQLILEVHSPRFGESFEFFHEANEFLTLLFAALDEMNRLADLLEDMVLIQDHLIAELEAQIRLLKPVAKTDFGKIGMAMPDAFQVYIIPSGKPL